MRRFSFPQNNLISMRVESKAEAAMVLFVLVPNIE